MANGATKVVICYSIYSYVRRWVAVLDHDSEVSSHANNVKFGEATITVNRADYLQIGPDALLAQVVGQPPGNDRCMVVSGNTVVAIIHADPRIDSHPQGRLILDTTGTAVVGQTI